MSDIVLASASPRRAELLAALGLRFDVLPSNEDEATESELHPGQMVEQLARRKAYSVAKLRPSCAVVGADTVVVHRGMVMGKPADIYDAARMLDRLQGDEHEVYTGVCVVCLDKGIEIARSEVTKVRFASMSALDIEKYIATGEPMDKAGAYAIQGVGSLFVTGITGDYFNVVGLPLRLTARLLSEAGVEVL